MPTLIVVYKTVTIIAIFQLVILGRQVAKKKESSPGRYLFLFIFVAFAFSILGNILLFYKINGLMLKLAHLANLTVFLSAPLFYLFVVDRIEKKSALKKNDLLHFVPFVAIFLLMSYQFIHNRNVFLSQTNLGVILISLLFFQNFMYLHAIKKLFNRNDIFLFDKNNHSNEVIWFKKIFVTFFIMVFVQLFAFIACDIFKLMVLCTFAVGISFLVSFLLINNIVLLWYSKPMMFEFVEKYRSKSPYVNNIDDYIRNLEKALYEDEVYLDPLLTLEKLSRITRIPRNYLSHIINKKYTANFNELVNMHRIGAAVEKLNVKSDQDAIINIAYDVGFNSKSTFNTAFKKFTSMTPSEYLSKNVMDHVN